MNHVALLGRLTRDPEVRYSQSANPIAIARYTLAVNRRYKREGEPDADFIQCVAFGKTAEFAQQYFVKGQQIALEGRIQVSSWDDKNTGQRRWSTEVIVENQYFAESRRDTQQQAQRQSGSPQTPQSEGVVNEPPQTGQTGNEQNNDANSANDSEDFFAIGDGLDDQNIPF